MVRVFLLITAYLIVLLAPMVSYAAITHLGVVDKVYPVNDVDFREQVNDINFKDEFDSWITNLPSLDLPSVESTTMITWSTDYLLEEDIVDHEGNLIYPKGTKVKPLEIYQPKARLVFFNDTTNQVSFAIELAKNNPLVKPVLTSGNYLNVQKQFDRPIYYAYAWLLSRFKVRNVPAVVGYFPEVSSTNMTTIYYPSQ